MRIQPSFDGIIGACCANRARDTARRKHGARACRGESGHREASEAGERQDSVAPANRQTCCGRESQLERSGIIEGPPWRGPFSSCHAQSNSMTAAASDHERYLATLQRLLEIPATDM
jgi:hypothetical protein